MTNATALARGVVAGVAALSLALAPSTLGQTLDPLAVTTSGSDANPCTQALPCRSFNRAYVVAQPGQHVEVGGGTYAAQTINVDATKTSLDDVVFRPAAGATVTVSGEVSVYGKHVEFRDMRFAGGWYARPGADDLTFRNIQSAHLFITSASNVSVLGGSIGPGVNYDSQVSTAANSSSPPTNILIDGVRFHDWTRTADQHVECLQFGSGVNVTIRNSRFENCATHDIFIRSWGTLNGGYYPLRNFVIENNFLDVTLQGFYSIQFIDDLATEATSFTVRNNSATQTWHEDITRGTITFTGNILASMSATECNGSVPSRWSHNVYESGVPCGATDRVGPVSYANRAALDLHLLPGSTAIDAGSVTSYPPTDIDGEVRYSGAAPDAGADETAGAPPDTAPPTVAVTAPADGATVTGTVTLAATASDENGVAGVQFRVDGVPVGGEDATAPYELGWDSTTVPNGVHTITAVARDAAGNARESSPVLVTVDNPPDTTPPETTITGGPSGTVTSTTATFSFASSEPGSTFACALDGAPPTACSSPASYSGLAAGQHMFRVAATDAAGNADGTPAERSWTVEPPPPGPVAAYSFNERGGRTFGDASGNGNTGTLNGANWTGTARYGGSALTFDGKDDWGTVPDSASLDLRAAATVEAWVRPTALGTTWRTVAIKEQPGELVYALYASSNTNRPAGIVFIASEIDARGTAQLALNAWTHLAVTYDGAAVRLYVNGSEVASRPASGTMPNSTGALRIGGNAVWGEWFRGQIDEVRIYGRALAAAEIRTDMNTPISP